MSRSLSRPDGATVVTAALLLAVTATWYALYSMGITVPSTPASGTLDQQYEAYYRAWFPSVVVQDLAISAIGTAAFLVLALAGALMARGAGGRTSRFLAGSAIAGGGALGAVAFLIQYGGHAAVAEAGGTTTSTEIIGFGAYAIERVADAIRLAGFALVGVGTIAAGGTSLQRVAGAVAGVALLALAVSGFAGDPLGYVDALRLLVALVAFPAWAVSQLVGGRDTEVALGRSADAARP